jgi:hypothetical protein
MDIPVRCYVSWHWMEFFAYTRKRILCPKHILRHPSFFRRFIYIRILHTCYSFILYAQYYNYVISALYLCSIVGYVGKGTPYNLQHVNKKMSWWALLNLPLKWDGKCWSTSHIENVVNRLCIPVSIKTWQVRGIEIYRVHEGSFIFFVLITVFRDRFIRFG